MLGILASSLPAINSLGHMTNSLESPAAHLYPKYFFNTENKLTSTQIEIESLSEFRNAINNEEQWFEVKKQLLSSDKFYYPAIFEQNLTDYSAFARLIKRALAQKYQLDTIARYHNNEGFTNEDRLHDVTKSLVKDFAMKARYDGAIPYVILFNNLGYSDHLFQVISPVLDEENIPYYSTHEKFSAENQGYFISDGHFKPEIDEQMARSIMDQLSTLQALPLTPH